MAQILFKTKRFSEILNVKLASTHHPAPLPTHPKTLLLCRVGFIQFSCTFIILFRWYTMMRTEMLLFTNQHVFLRWTWNEKKLILAFLVFRLVLFLQRCSSLERPLSATSNSRNSNASNTNARQCPSPIPAHVAKGKASLLCWWITRREIVQFPWRAVGKCTVFRYGKINPERKLCYIFYVFVLHVSGAVL